MDYDVLNACSPYSSQVLPFCIRDLLSRIFDRRSTTARIRKMNGFHLEVLKKTPFRDVAIYNGNNLFMYARTIAPKMTQEALKGIYHFERPSPIGDFLFHSPAVKRGPVDLQLQWHAPDWLSDYETQTRLYSVRQTHWYYQKVYLIELIEVFV